LSILLLMKAREGTFRDLMSQDRQFQVPLYQRHYRWNSERQRDLWSDILAQYEAGREGTGSARHFIGSIVAVQLDPDPMNDFRHFRIVDGQQRMTTLSVALAALRDVAATEDSSQTRKFNEKYLVNPTEEPSSPLWQRLVPGDEDSLAYRTILTDPDEVDGHSAVGAAYRFFRARIEELRDAGTLHPGMLATTVNDRLSLVFVTVDEDERPHTIFESINATGTELSQADLLRNYLFMALGDRSNAVYQEHWRPLERLLGNDALESLVRDDLQAGGSFVNSKKVYRTHREQLAAETSGGIEAKVKSLHRRGRYYGAFLRPQEPEPASALGLTQAERSHLAFLRAWGAGTTYPFFLHLYDLLAAGQVTHEESSACLGMVESFLVRRHLVAVPTNVLNRLFIQLINALPESEPIAESLHRELSRDERWPDDEELLEGIRTVPFYTQGRGHQRKLILQRLEEALRTEVAVDFDSANLSIEHVMPQTMTDEWRRHVEAGGDDPDELFRQRGHTLGNLTLTRWNSTLSRRLPQRKAEILGNSELRLNDPLTEIAVWRREQIEERASWLAKTAARLWIAPLPGVFTPGSGFDWSRVDGAVQAVPPGCWTSYGDLAALAGTAAQPVATHVAGDPALTRAYRVLSSDGSISPQFKWTDPKDPRDPIEILTGEGVEFDQAGRASQAQRLGPSQLSQLIGEDDQEP
jgi:alkylated DNA nucleotide flippase Atl1